MTTWDISDSENPRYMGWFNTDEAKEMTFTDNYAFIVNGDRQEAGFYIADISDPEEPTQVGYGEVENARYIEASQDYAFVGANDFHVLSILNKERPRITGSCEWFIGRISASDEYVFVAAGDHGLRVIDVSDPENPAEVGYFETLGKARDVYFSEGLIYVAESTDIGIYRFIPPSAVTDSREGQLPEVICLSPAYPNPFNGQLRIDFALKASGQTSLRAYDLSGREVGVVADGNFAAGAHSVSWQADGMPSGLYILKLRSAGETRTMKTMLIK